MENLTLEKLIDKETSIVDKEIKSKLVKLEKQKIVLNDLILVTFEGLNLPTKGQAVWNLPAGDLVYVELEITEITCNANT